jgi:tetratricopeptide (TPR) repeat protein
MLSGRDADLDQGMALHAQGRLRDAERTYRRVLQQQPRNCVAVHMLGLVALQTGRSETAARLIGKAIALQPDYVDAYNNLGLALQELGRHAAAIDNYDKAIMLRPDDADLHSNRGLALEALARWDEALASYDKAIALRPKFPEAHNNRGNALQSLQRPEEAVAAHATAVALRPDIAAAHYNHANALRLVGRFAEAVACYERAITRQPDYAAAYNNRGLALQALLRWEDAVASYDRAIACQPSLAEAYNNRGTALQGSQRLDDALASYDSAIALRPGYAEAYNNLGTTLQSLKRPKEAVQDYSRALKLAPDFPEAYQNRACSLYDLQRSEQALADFDTAIGLRPNYAEAYNNKAVCLLRMGRFAEGWPLYEWRRKRPGASADRVYAQPLWLGSEQISGKTVFIYWEQGLGDTVLFCRYAKLARECGARVILQVQRPLVRLLAQLGPGIEVIGPEQRPADFDYHCPLLSLPLAFGTDVSTIPSLEQPLQADARLCDEWAARLPATGRPRVGIAWSGGTSFANDYSRSIDLATFRVLLHPSVDWICIQKELRPGDHAALMETGIRFFGEQQSDFADTAALLDQVDQVVAVDTSVAHVAATMGKPVWLLLSYNADWRWLLDRPDTPWYPSVRLIRQSQPGSWDEALRQVKRELQLL